MTDVLQGQIEALLARHWQSSVTVRDLTRLTAGASAQTWRFQANGAPLILRLGQPGEQMPLMLNKGQEADLLVHVHKAGLPVPEVILKLPEGNPIGQGFVMRCLTGETLPQKILAKPEFAAAREKLTEQCGSFLAKLHNLPTKALGFLPEASNQAYLQRYRELHNSFGQPVAAFELAFACLKDELQEPARRTLVHGDFRNGNLMVNEDGLHAVFDWELSRVGDPLEDLAWICVNSWRFGKRDKAVGGFGDRAELIDAYQANGDAVVDARQLKLWELFGVLRWGVIIQYQYDLHVRSVERSLERVAIGRRLSECELDIAVLVEELVEENANG